MIYQITFKIKSADSLSLNYSSKYLLLILNDIIFSAFKLLKISTSKLKVFIQVTLQLFKEKYNRINYFLFNKFTDFFRMKVSKILDKIIKQKK